HQYLAYTEVRSVGDEPPMGGNMTHPRQPTFRHRHAWVESASHGLVDDGLLLLLQQLDELLLRPDVAPDASVRMIEEADDGGLFVRWGNGHWNTAHPVDREVPLTDPNAVRNAEKEVHIGAAS